MKVVETSQTNLKLFIIWKQFWNSKKDLIEIFLQTELKGHKEAQYVIMHTRLDECKNLVNNKNFLHQWTHSIIFCSTCRTRLLILQLLFMVFCLENFFEPNLIADLWFLCSTPTSFSHLMYDRLKEKLIKKGKHLKEMLRSIYWIIIIRFGGGFMRNLEMFENSKGREKCRMDPS